MIISLDFPYCLQRIFLSGAINLVFSILFLEDKVLSKRAVTTSYSLYKLYHVVRCILERKIEIENSLSSPPCS